MSVGGGAVAPTLRSTKPCTGDPKLAAQGTKQGFPAKSITMSLTLTPRIWVGSGGGGGGAGFVTVKATFEKTVATLGVPPLVMTSMRPVVASAGTSALSVVSETTVKVAGPNPLNPI